MDPILIVAIVATVILGGSFAVPKIVEAFKPKNPDGTPKAAAGDFVGTVSTELSTFLKGLGIVQDLEELKGNVKQIAAFGAVVLVQPHVADVVDAEQQAAVNAA